MLKFKINAPTQEECSVLRVILDLPRNKNLDNTKLAYIKNHYEEEFWLKHLTPLLWKNHRLVDYQYAYNDTQRQNLAWWAHINWIKKELHEFNWAAIKGVALTWLIYQDLGLRPMGDMDIIAPQSELNEIVATLKKQGVTPGYKASNIDIFFKARHALNFHKNNKNFLDLHSYFSQDMNNNRYENLAQYLIAVDFQGICIKVPIPEIQFLITCIHGIGPRKQANYQWIADTNAILTHTPDFSWDILWEGTQKMCKETELLPALLVLRQLDIEIPQTILDKLHAKTGKINKSYWHSCLTFHSQDFMGRIIQIILIIKQHCLFKPWQWPRYIMYSRQINISRLLFK